MRERRKSKVQPSQVDRSIDNPKVKPGAVYNVDAYRRAITRACEGAGIKHWHPNQLRHLAATNLRREFGLEVARAVLGHSTVAMTEVYAEMDAAKAREAMAKRG
jgi:integrase